MSACTIIPQPEPVPLEDVSVPGHSGRIESYIHSDTITANKGGAMVKVICDTDFAARTTEFFLFARMAAKLAYGASAKEWADIVAAFPYMEAELQKVKHVLREEVAVVEVKVMKI